MATTGATAPTAAASVAESPWSDDAWVNPTNIYGTGEASVTTTQFDADDQTEVLKAYTFGFSLPAGAVIDGVTCIINARYANALGKIDLVQLLDVSRAKVGTNLAATPVDLTTSAANYTFGSATNLWGNALTDTWVEDADFGVAIGCLAGGSGNNNVDVFIDSVTLNVAYHIRKNFADTLDLTSLTSNPKLNKTAAFSDTLALTSLTSNAKLYKSVNFSDTLGLSSITSEPVLSLGAVVNFADTLALTSLTSTPALGLMTRYDFSDTLALTSLTSTPDLFRLVDFRTERLVDSLTVNVGTLTSGDKTNTYTSNDSRLVITEGTGLGNAFDVEFVFKAISDVPYGVFIEGYYQGNVGHNVKLKIKNNSSAWDNVTSNTQDIPHNTSDQVYFFNLPSLTNYISSGQITLKLEHTSAGTPGHTLNIDKMIVMPIITSLTSTAKLTKEVTFADTLALTSLTSTPVLIRLIGFADTLDLSSLTSTAALSVMTVKDFSDTLALTSLTSTPKLFKQVDLSDTLALTSLTSTADLYREVTFSDTLALTSLTSEPALTLGTIFNFSDTLALTSLTSNPKLYKEITFADTLDLTSLTSNPTMTISGIIQFADTLSLTSLTSSPKLTILAEYRNIQVLYDGSIVIGGIVRI